MSLDSTASSPDPLALSYDGHFELISSPIAPVTRSKAHYSSSDGRWTRTFQENSPGKRASPGRRASPMKDTLRRNEEEQIRSAQKRSFTFSTPVKGRQAKRDGSSSPWKIKVTVEAEPNKATGARRASPIKRVDSKSVKVPLKGADEHVPVKRRGRPRKSNGTPLPVERHVDGSPGVEDVASTPLELRAEQKTGSVLGLANNGHFMAKGLYEDDPQLEDRRTRGKPRSSNADPRVSGTGNIFLGEQHDKSGLVKQDRKGQGEVSNTDYEKIPRRRSNRHRTDFAFGALTPLHQKPNNAGLLATPDIGLSPWVGLCKNKAWKTTKGRVPTPRKPAHWTEPDDKEDETSLSSSQLAVVHMADSSDKIENSRTYNEYDTKMLDQTAFENEAFSIVSLESLKNRSELAVVPRHTPANTKTSMEKVASTLALQAEQGIQEPSLLQKFQVSSPTSTTSVPSNSLQLRGEANPTPSSSVENHDQLWAQNRSSSPEKKTFLPSSTRRPRHETHEAFVTVEYNAEHQGNKLTSHAQSGYPQRLPTPAESIVASDDFLSKHSPCMRENLQVNAKLGILEASNESPRVVDNVSGMEHSQLNCTEILQEEYRRQRQDVIRQIKEANTSQVIVIDDSEVVAEIQQCEDARRTVPNADSLAANDDDNDIWWAEIDRSLEEYNAGKRGSDRQNKGSNSHPVTRKRPREMEEETLDIQELLTNDVHSPKPKISRTWRWTNDVDSPQSREVKEKLSKVKVTVTRNDVDDIDENEHSASTPISTNGIWWATRRSSPRHEKNIPIGILNTSPLRQGSPPKEVRFNDSMHVQGTTSTRKLSIPKEDEAYFSDSLEESGVGKSHANAVHGSPSVPPEDEVDATFLHNQADLSPVQISNVETSDMRQLERELQGTARSAGSSVTESCSSSQADHRDSRSLLQPRRPCPPLSDPRRAPRQPTKSQCAASRSVDQRLDLANQTESEIPAPGLLARLASWLFHSVSVASTDAQSSKQTKSLTWTRNHYLLLNHIYRLPFPPRNQFSSENGSKSASLNDRLRHAYHLPLPKELEDLNGQTFTTGLDSDNSAGKIYSLQLEESHARMAHAFIVETREAGIPWLCDGSFHADDGRRKTADGYPLRDSAGRVLRTREDWGGREVCVRVFSLWVGECMRDEQRRWSTR